LQNQFQNWILRQPSTIDRHIVSTKKASAAARLEIYREGYYLRLIEVLQLEFPAIFKVLGGDEFDQLCRRFIDAYPSHFRSVRWYGNELANFMRHAQPYCDQPALIELAEFEWALSIVFDEQDSHIIRIEDMAKVQPNDWPQLRFKLHPAMRRLNLAWNTVQIWKATKENLQSIDAHPTETLESWIIWRKHHEPQFCSLLVDEAYFIDAINVGEDFGSICAGLTEWIDEQNVGMHAATLLKRYILDELITDLIIE
jgi:hypothetical protein